MTDPMTPPNCDLRDFAFMPLDAARLFGSEFHAISSDAGWRAGVTLWLKAWHQVPAGSLPDEDVQLARLAEFGRDVRRWKKVRAEALRGWVLASDGRRYNPVVAVYVLESWLEKLNRRATSVAGNQKKYGKTFDVNQVESDLQVAVAMLERLSPASKKLMKSKKASSREDRCGTGEGAPSGSQETGTGINTLSNDNDGKPSVDLTKTLFDAGVDLLTSKGVEAKSARSFLAKLQRDYGDPVVLDAINRSREATDPRSAIMDRCLKTKQREAYVGI